MNFVASSGKYLFHSMLENIQIGQLTLVDKSTGDKVRFRSTSNQQPPQSTSVTLIITNPQKFYFNLLLSADIGFAQSYINKDFVIENDDLTACLQLFVLNREHFNDLSTSTAYLSSVVNFLHHSQLANTITNSLSNISAHYDLGNELFESFLDETLTYSSAVFASPNDTLHEAQLRKLDMIIQKARLTSTDRVLEIGSGWGSFCIRAVQQTGCSVVSITLSKEQKTLAEERISKLPKKLSSKIKIILADYRDLPKMFEGKPRFDKIVSIEMLEAVGPQFLSTYFNVVHQLLHPSHGIMVFQCITMPDSRYSSYLNGCDFIQRYIFPGGHCPSVSAIISAVQQGSNSNLIVDNLENIGPHYARTLRNWRENFVQNFDSHLASFEKFTEPQTNWLWTNKKEHFYSNEFKRKWLYYFCYCEAGFATRTLGNVQIVLTREGNVEMLRGIENVVL